MSRVLYGRSLPSELVDVIKAAVTVPSVCTTPNNQPSTTFLGSLFGVVHMEGTVTTALMTSI